MVDKALDLQHDGLNWVSRRAAKHRQARMRLFQELLATAKRPLRILDAGGLEAYWTQLGFTASEDLHITLLNLESERVHSPRFTSVPGDVRDMRLFGDAEFDVVYSNSVIEHVGNLSAQLAMAREIQRVGKAYFIQTPNRGFFLEPHFFIPFVHWLPRNTRPWVVTHFGLQVGAAGLRRRRPSPELLAEAAEIRLLSRRELRACFPGAAIWTERWCGMAKSFIAYGRWNLIRGAAGS